MKPCTDRKEAIALLAANALAPSERAAVQRHLQECPACNTYAAQIATACALLGKRGANSVAAEPAPGFHARLKHRIQSEPQRRSIVASLRTFRDWFTPTRLVSAAAAATLVAAFAFWVVKDGQRFTAPVAQLGKPSGGGAEATSTDLPTGSTLMAYQAAFNRSFEELDSLVTENSRRSSTSEGMTLMARGGTSF